MSNNLPEVSIIIPTRHRHRLLKERLETIFKHTKELATGVAELIIVADIDDDDTYEMLSNIMSVPRIVTSKQLETPANKWNQAAKIAHGEWLVTISDDCIPEEAWLTHALGMLTHGFIGLPDGVTGARNLSFTPLYMATKTWLRKYHGGVLVIPHYKSWYADVETAIRAHRSGTYMVGANSVVTQLHTVFGTAEDDEIYRIGEMRRAEDLATYNLRSSYGFPDDFERVL